MAKNDILKVAALSTVGLLLAFTAHAALNAGLDDMKSGASEPRFNPGGIQYEQVFGKK